MPGELGESQLSSLLESVPGLASVLRSPVADAIVNMIRAGAGLGDYREEDARELVQYATRRGLIPQSEGAELIAELEAAAAGGGRKAKAGKPRKAAQKATRKASARQSRARPRTLPKAKGVRKTGAGKKATTKKTAKKVAKKTGKKVAKKATKTTKAAKRKTAKKKRR